MVDEGYYWIKRPSDDWVIGEFYQDAWWFCGNEEEWDEPGGEVGPKIEAPEWVVIFFPGGTTHGPFTQREADNYVAKQYPGSGAKAVKK